MTPRQKTLGIVIALQLVGCQSLKHRETPSYGLKLVEIAMTPVATGDLNSTVRAKTPIEGDVAIDGKTMRAKINYAGQSTLDDFKKSFHLRFQEGRLEGHEEYRLSSQSVDPSALRSLVGLYVFKQAGVATPKIEPVAAYFNGEFRGLYFLIEPVDEDFFKGRDVEVRSLYEARYGNATFATDNLTALDQAFDIKSKPKAPGDLERLIALIGEPSTPENQKNLEAMLDVGLYLKYVAAAVALHHWDGFRNNFVLYHDARDDRFRIVPWDLDQVYSTDPDVSPFVTGTTIWGDNALTAKILSYSELKTRYLDELAHLLTELETGADAFVAEKVELMAEAFAHDRVLAHDGATLAEKSEALRAAMRDWLGKLKADLERQKGS